MHALTASAGLQPVKSTLFTFLMSLFAFLPGPEPAPQLPHQSHLSDVRVQGAAAQNVAVMH